jgi:hypothetical protein
MHAHPDDDDSEVSRFVPTESWIAAFEAQATHALRLRARRFARARSHLVARSGARVDDRYISALVQDALTDTLLGVLVWNPAKRSLEQHLFAAIRARTYHDCVRAQRFLHQSLYGEDPGASPDALAFSDEVLAQIRALAGTDRPIHRILDALALGAAEGSEITFLANMSPRIYHKARIRLARVFARLATLA